MWKNRWCNSLLCFAMGTPYKSSLDISRHNGGYTGLRTLAQRHTGINIFTPGNSCPPNSMCNNWKRSPWLWSTQNWHPFSFIRSSDGDIPCWRPCLYHHAHQQMVKWCFPLLHRKQVEQFSKHVAKQMLMFWSFRTIPGIAPCMVSDDDPRQFNHLNNAKTRCNIGRHKSWQVQLPAFSLFNWSIDNIEAINGRGIISPVAEGVRRGKSWKNF